MSTASRQGRAKKVRIVESANDEEMNPPGRSPQAIAHIRQWGAVLWPSFLIAGVATMIFFANVDPAELQQSTFPDLHLSRKLGYTIGFFMFWGVTAWSSFLTMLLLRPAGGPRRSPREAVD